jgi:NADH-quinone oxidoreductase subunit C
MTPRQAIEKLLGRVGEPVEFRGEISVVIERAQIVEACRYLKDKCGFDMLTDLAGVDNYGDDPRYEVVYHLYSLANRCRLRLKVKVLEDDLTVNSVTGVWRTADWHEREVFDMFGIRFRDHPNLKRILMWEGYPHHPLRKEFPLAGQEAELPDTAVDAGKVEAAPQLGGPFVSPPGTRSSVLREPRQADTAAERQEKSEQNGHPTRA